MAKKEVYHTGEYKFRLPERIEMSAELQVDPVMKQRPPCIPLRWKIAILAVILFMLVYYVGQRFPPRDFITRVQTILCCGVTPTPGPDSILRGRQNREVTIDSLDLYSQPVRTSVIVHTLRRGDPVRLLGQYHQCPDGETWTLVGYRPFAQPSEHDRTGWLIAEGISEK